MSARAPRPRKPILVWCADPDIERQNELALARVGGPESLHDLNGAVATDMSHAVIACGRCGGVYGGDGVKWRDGKIVGRVPTKRCECKRGRR